MKQRTGYDYSRAWFDFSFENPELINPNHSALFFFCIEHCNRLGWKDKFGLPTSMAKEAIGIKHYNTYIKTLTDLIEFGFIELIEKSKNQYSSNIIAMSIPNKASNKALDKASIKHVIKQVTKQSESTGESKCSIDKPLTINQEPYKQEFDFFIDSMNEILGKQYLKATNYYDDFVVLMSHGIKPENILSAIKVATHDEFHKSKDFNLLSPSYILKLENCDRLLNSKSSFLADKEYFEGKEVIVDKLGDKWYMVGDVAKRIYPPKPDYTGWTNDEIYNYETCPRFTDKISMDYIYALDSQNNTTEAEKRGVFKHFYNQETLQMRYADHTNIRTS